MAQTRKRPGTITYGSLAYDLDTLARERQLDEAGRLEEREEAAPRRANVRKNTAAVRPAPQAAQRPSLLTVGGVLVMAALVVLLIMGYVHLTTVSADVSEMKEQLAALNEEHVALVTKYEQTFDLTTVKEAAEAAGMSKPTGAQIEYLDLSGTDTAVVYRAGVGGLWGGLTDQIRQGIYALVEYFR